jgi:hypothetical protein
MAAGHEVGAWRGLILLLAMTAGSGCEANRITGATLPVPTSVGFADVDLVTSRIEGRVVDEDEAALPDATVTIARVLSDGRYQPVEQSAARATADDRGGFGFNASLPRKWSEIVLRVLRDGYDPTDIYVDRSLATAVVLRAYRTLTIRPGESIDIRLSLGSYVCGMESWRCRRVIVSAPSGEVIDLEVTPSNADDEVGLLVGEIAPAFFKVERHVTLTGGPVWIVGPNATVTLTARAAGR